ncbi:MAG: YfhO family protein, partial [Liquorilactobacillus ghanensis]|uniref:YfhO family protein n=1 Tax=Liquorilactobacillus ghanensis TaxID=399370 RepID=UPI0039EAB977
HYFKTVKVLKSKDSRTLQSHYIYQHAITLQAKQTGPVYLENLTRNGLDYASIKIDNHRIIHMDENLDGFRSIQYLGTFKAGQKFKLTFTAADAAILQKLQIKSLDATAFNQLRSQLSQTAVQLHYRPNGWKTELTAQTKPRKHGYWLYLAIPADSGWTASNGQQKLKIERALSSMMVVRVPKNTTRISLTYHVPGLVIAAWLSISAVVFYLIWAKFAGQQLRQSRDANLNTLKKKK